MGWGWDTCCGGGWGMPFFGLGPLLLVLIVGGAIYYFVNLRSSNGKPLGPSSREILDRRYAAGEITKEQFEQMKRDLQ